MLTLIDKLAGKWMDMRTRQAIKSTHKAKEAEEFTKLEIKDIKFDDGYISIKGVSPAIAIMADHAAQMLQKWEAKNYVQFDMFPRPDRSLRPIRVTVQWANGKLPATRVIEMEQEVERLKHKIEEMSGTQWIPVSEQLPEPSERVIVALSSHYLPPELFYWTHAIWIPKHSRSADDYQYEGDDLEWNEEETEAFWPEGWYEEPIEGDISYRLSDKVYYWAEVTLPAEKEPTE